MGNGRATTLRFAQEGAKVMAVDRDLTSAEETACMVEKEGGDCFAFQADVTKESTLKAAIEAAKEQWGHIDILHYNVGSNTALTFCNKMIDRRYEEPYLSAIILEGLPVIWLE